MAGKRKGRVPSRTPNQSNYAQSMGRRRAVQNLALYGIGGAVLLGGAGLFAADLHGKLVEARFDDIGNGTPTVLQIHDPNCQLCAQLQKQTRLALRAFEPGSVQFRVADIRSTQGAQIASRYGVPHITLVLLDGRGQVRRVISGVTPAAEIQTLIYRHLRLPLTG